MKRLSSALRFRVCEDCGAGYVGSRVQSCSMLLPSGRRCSGRLRPILPKEFCRRIGHFPVQGPLSRTFEEPFGPLSCKPLGSSDSGVRTRYVYHLQCKWCNADLGTAEYADNRLRVVNGLVCQRAYVDW